MKVSPFSSEFSDEELPDIPGPPKPKSVVKKQVRDIPLEEQLQAAINTLMAEAVYPYYFMKRLFPTLSRVSQEEAGPLSKAAEHVASQLMKQTVVGIAASMDGMEGTNSFFAIIKRAREEFKEDLHPERDALRELLLEVQHLTDTTREDRSDSLQYVHYLRNKWAAHASPERRFDDWLGTDESVNFPLLEDALVKLVNVAHALGELKHASDRLQELDDSWRRTTEPDGTEFVKMTVDLEGAHIFAEMTRDKAQMDADAFLAELKELHNP